MRIDFDTKFTERGLDIFVDRVFKNLQQRQKDVFIFDFSKVEWISNQEILVFTGLLKYFVTNNIDFQIEFFKKGTFINEIPLRVAKQLIELWDVWNIWKIIPNQDYIRYFGFDNIVVRHLNEIHNYYPNRNEIYSRYGITPFVSLDYIDNYTDKDVEDSLKHVFKLNDVLTEIVHTNRCEHPFLKETLTSIIAKELYENFLDHFSSTIFNSTDNWAFTSLSLRGKINEKQFDKEAIQRILKKNFLEEQFLETRGFFYDVEKEEFRNRSFLEFSFLDFGKGIAGTLTEQYKKQFGLENTLFIDNNSVLKYAFDPHSSRYPLDKKDDYEFYIPHGLFDLLSIVKRYEGIIIVRSNYGKILYDFSNNKDFDKAFSHFGDPRLYFPGTLITIYIPAFSSMKKFDSSAIKPTIQYPSHISNKKYYLNVYHIINKIKSKKEDLYSSLLKQIRIALQRKEEIRTTYFSFRGYESDKRLAKKILYYLLSDYQININNNVIILYPPAIEIVEEIQEELLNLTSVLKNYKIHPLPLIYFTIDEDDINLKWLGIYDEVDRNKLSELLLSSYSLTKSDFNDPGNVIGHVNYFDQYGNLNSQLPEKEQLLKIYKKEHSEADNNVVNDLIKKNSCIKDSRKDEFYLCNANYYQYQFVEIIHLLNNRPDCNLISEILFRRIFSKLVDGVRYTYIGVTSSSHKIIFSLIDLGFIEERDVILLDNYLSFETDEKFKIEEESSYVLICDVIATGTLTNRLIQKLEEKKSKLVAAAVIVDTIDRTFENSETFLKKYSDKIVSLFHYPIKKYRREHSQIKEDLKKKQLIRINPFTNLPITLSIQETNYKSVIFSNQEFLELISEENIYVGYFKFNNLIHPYFFNTENIIKAIDEEFLKRLFKGIKISGNDLKIFYPKNSGLKYLDFNVLKNKIFKDHSIEIFELERFNTTEGWKFTHTAEYILESIKDKSVLILDDGSCSGDSLIQMIDEIALSSTKEISLVCLIGRVNDYKREFFSRITEIKTKNERFVKIQIYFATQWHIPTYYLDENPNTNEVIWLRNVIDLPNTPESIKKIARSIKEEITPKSLELFKDYKYLPKIKNTLDIIDKKELIQVREEIGKIIGYRFYRENFVYFNELIKKYESRIKENRNKEMELLCSTFLYEPYLFQKIKQVLPDIVDKIEEFVDALIFGNPKKGNRLINIESELTYEWDKKDILHLFFIVYQNRQLLDKLNDTHSIEKLLNFIKIADITITYFLFKLLAYFPIKKDEISQKKNIGSFLHLFDILLQNRIIPSDFLKEIKIFRSFVSTLPSNTDYYSRLSKINENYRKIIDAALHKESVLVECDVMLVDLEAMNNEFSELAKSKFVESWIKVSQFIEDILSFSGTFPTFFLEKLSSIEGNNEYSLRSIHGKLNDLINNINPKSELDFIKNLLSKFRYNFLSTDSELFKIFNCISTSNTVENVIIFFQEGGIKSEELEVEENIQDNITIDVPFYIFKEVIFYEIVTNMRHRDASKKVKLSFKVEAGILNIVIINEIAKHPVHGGGSGLNMLSRINKFPNDIIKFRTPKGDFGIFKQELKIKLI